MLVTDAQIHLWEDEPPDRPWPKDGRSTPHRPNGFTAEQMLAEMDPPASTAQSSCLHRGSARPMSTPSKRPRTTRIGSR